MPLLSIAGINVDFPREPYKCQLDYMEGVIRALSTGTNALLESPTGTGKTLCLLCATLAWQETKRSKPMELVYSNGSSLDGNKTNPGIKAPPVMIVYASRTHSQLAQVVSELKETSYKPRMTVMGSREQLCIHEKVSKLKKSVLNHACNSLNSKRSCMYRNNLENYIETGSSSDSSSMMDIEELVKLGTHRKICPYFHSREYSPSADLVLLPYNYLLDSTIRKTLKLDWSRCIIIFDEAHNLERVASDAASFSFSSTDIALCIQEMKQVLTILRDEQQNNPSGATVEADTKQQQTPNITITSNNNNNTIQKPSLQSVVHILKALFEFEQRIDSLQMKSSSYPSSGYQTQAQSGPGSSSSSSQLPGLMYPGHWLGQLLSACALCSEQIVEDLRRCCNMLMEAAQDAMAGESSSGAATLQVEPKLQAFTLAIDRVVRSIRTGSSIDYRVYITDEIIKQNNTTTNNTNNGYMQISSTNSHNLSTNKQYKRIINYWCFSTGVAMCELQNLGIKSMLLTSGTLSPMLALREDIKIPFSVQLENPHVITEKQMWVAAISTGASGKSLNSSYQHRDTAAYKDELGTSVLQICLTMTGRGDATATTTRTAPEPTRTTTAASWAAYGITAVRRALPTTTMTSTTTSVPSVPVRGGVLIFFPSYGVMENIATHWKETGVFDKLRAAVGSILMEPKASGNTTVGNSNTHTNSKKGYNNTTTVQQQPNFMLSAGTTKSKSLTADEDEGDGSSAEFRNIVGQFEHSIKTYGGCVLLAVCRGKVSEGIDFTDNKGRVVIITGIPFAPYMDPWVVLKKQYLDEKITTGSAKPAMPLQSVDGLAPLPVPPIEPTSAEIVSAFHQPIAPSAYAGVLPTASSGYSKSLSTASTSIASTCVSAAPALMPPPAPVTNKTTSAAATLTGQGWYSQSAGRAVNQCIGRVIRHNRDWGTVFLLDDRFMNDRQLAQLSSWVKPRVKKYTNFTTSLQSFRSFLNIAATDKTLISQAMQQRISEAQPDYERYLRREKDLSRGTDDSAFSRQVEINVNALPDAGDDNTFIDPTFLLTQQSQQSSRANNCNHRRDSEEDMLAILGRSQSTQSQSTDKVGITTDKSQSGSSGSLLGAFSRLRDKNTTGTETTAAKAEDQQLDAMSPIESNYVPLSISYNGSTTTSNISTNTTRPRTSTDQTTSSASTSSFGLAANPKSTAFHVPAKVIRSKDSTIADYFAAPTSTTTTSSSSQSFSQKSKSNQNVKKPTIDIPKFSQNSGNNLSGNITLKSQPNQTEISRPQSFLSYLSQLDDDLYSKNPNTTNPMANFHKHIGILKELVSKDKLKEIKAKLLYMRNNPTASTTQIHTFIQDMLTLLGTVDIHLTINILHSFCIILPKQINENYMNLVNLITKNKTTTTTTSSSNSIRNNRKQQNFIDMTSEQEELTLSQKNIQTHIKSILLESKRKIDDSEPPYSQNNTTSITTGTGTTTMDIKPESGNRFVPSKRATLALSNSLSKTSSLLNQSTPAHNRVATGGSSLLSLQSKTSSLLNSLKSTKTVPPGIVKAGGTTTSATTIAAGGGTGSGNNQVLGRSTGRSRLAGLDEIALSGPIRASNVIPTTDRHSRIGSSSITSSGILHSKLVCAVCKETASQPCAGRCGHVCCQECWMKWLKVNSSCPLCRAPADRTSVTRIIIK